MKSAFAVITLIIFIISFSCDPDVVRVWVQEAQKAFPALEEWSL